MDIFLQLQNTEFICVLGVCACVFTRNLSSVAGFACTLRAQPRRAHEVRGRSGVRRESSPSAAPGVAKTVRAFERVERPSRRLMKHRLEPVGRASYLSGTEVMHTQVVACSNGTASRVYRTFQMTPSMHGEAYRDRTFHIEKIKYKKWLFGPFPGNGC